MRDDAISCQRKIQIESLCFGLRLDFVYLLKIASVYKEKYTLYTDAAFCFSLHHFIYNTGSSRYELTCLIRIYKIFRHHTQHIGTAVPIYKELHHTTTVQGAVLQILSLPCSFLITGLHPGSVRPDVR